MKNSVFVLGATGYIGQRIVTQLLSSGYRVEALVRNPEKAEFSSDRVQLITGDLLEPKHWIHHLDDKVAVINAAFPGHGSSWAEAVKQESMMVAQMIDRLKHQTTKLILSNGTAFLGDSGKKRLDEQAAVQEDHPASVRAKTISDFRHQSNDKLSVLELRLASFVYGHGGSVFIPILLDSAKRNGKSIYVDHGEYYTSTVHVDAAARAYLQAIEHGEAGAVYHIAGDEEPSIKQIAQAVALAADASIQTVSLSHEEALNYVDPFTAMFLRQNNRLDSQKARRELGWSGHTASSLFYDVAYGSYAEKD